jgi:hypothetical protein
MVEGAFSRAELTGAASLNKRVVSVGPYAGRSGADLLSRDAIAALAPKLRPSALSDDLAAHPEGRAISLEVGRRLAALVATLRRGPDDAPVSERTPVRVRVLKEWAAIPDVVVGGGLVAGSWGQMVLEAARTELATLEAPPTRLSLAPNAPYLGLIGAARTGTFDDGEHLVLDAGQTSIKRAMAQVSGSELLRMELLPPVPFRVGLDIAQAIASILDEASPVSARSPVRCSIASYVRDGQPIIDNASPYESLHRAPRSLLDRLVLIHDGAAAWRGTGRASSSAVIVMGTWLGVGMGPHPGTHLISLHENFTVTPLHTDRNGEPIKPS